MAVTSSRAPAGDADPATGPLVTADGVPLKTSLARAQRRQTLMAIALVLPLFVFIMVSFIAPMVDMLMRSVANPAVSTVLARSASLLDAWDPGSGDLPGEDLFAAVTADLAAAAANQARMEALRSEASELRLAAGQAQRALDDDGADVAALTTEIAATEERIARLEAEARSLQSLTHNNVARLLNYQSAGMRSIVGDGGDAALGVETAPASTFLTGIDGDVWGAKTVWTKLQDVAKAGGPAAALLTTAAPLLEAWPARGRAPAPEAIQAAFLADFEAASPEQRAALAEALSAQEGGGGGAFSQFAIGANQASGPDYDEQLAAIEAGLAARAADPVRYTLLAAHDGWAEVETWATLRQMAPPYIDNFYLESIDYVETATGVMPKDEADSLYLTLFWRTIVLSLLITFMCFLLGYPISYLLATQPPAVSNLLIILVLLPFWTSLLVRTAAWRVLLQEQGVLNDMFVFVGLVGDDSRFQMFGNQFATVVAMTHILLPFMILPMYSVMKGISPSYVRAAQSMGATPTLAFLKVYFPNTLPGVGAGAILVFILAIGYYITPELVGGADGKFISNRIAYQISVTGNWGLGAALGSILLVGVLIIYFIYDRFVGIDKIKLG